MRDDDAQLIESFLRGDRAALGRVDDWIRRAAWVYRRRLVNDWDDLCQDLRLEITRLLRAGRFAGKSRLRTYVWRVVNNACLDRLRAKRRWAWTELEDAHAALDRSGLERPPMGERLAARELLRKVLAKTSAECRRLWSMVVAGLSYRQMSERLEISAGTLRVRVLRCRKKAIALRRELEM